VKIAGGYTDDEFAYYTIRDTAGKLAQQGTLNTDRQISMESLQSGWYFISIYTSNNNVGTLKVFKN
jgi:hypothetical protein